MRAFFFLYVYSDVRGDVYLIMVHSGILNGHFLDVGTCHDESFFLVFLLYHAVGILALEGFLEPGHRLAVDLVFRLSGAINHFLVVESVLVVESHLLMQVVSRLGPVVAIFILGVFLKLVGAECLCAGSECECKEDDCCEYFLHFLYYL